MRMVEGRTLREAIRDKETLDRRLALLPAVIAAADAVAFAHDKRIIHRDLTPNNILVGAYGDTVVIDWGLAKDLSDGGDDGVAAGPYRDESTVEGLTNAGAVIGTAAYMPPSKRVAQRSTSGPTSMRWARFCITCSRAHRRTVRERATRSSSKSRPVHHRPLPRSCRELRAIW